MNEGGEQFEVQCTLASAHGHLPIAHPSTFFSTRLATIATLYTWYSYTALPRGPSSCNCFYKIVINLFILYLNI